MNCSLTRVYVNSLEIKLLRNTYSFLEKIIEHTLADLAQELKIFNRNDVLVNIEASPIQDIDQNEIIVPQNHELNKIYKSSLQQFKESGAHVFCVSTGVLLWDWKGKNCESPILLCPAQITYNKIKQQYKITFDETEAFLNPFLAVEFQKLFDFEWPTIGFFATDWEILDVNLKNAGFHFSIKKNVHFGNFHHHRYTILRDVESLEKCTQFSQPLSEFMQLNNATPFKKAMLPEQLLFPADNDQKLVFMKCEEENLVVQGPPGTGKSQVLANFLGKNLFGQLSSLVVSEKRIALEVLKKKLSPSGLDRFCFLPRNTNNSHEFLSQLKETWLFLESCEEKQPFQLNLSQQKIDSLQFKLNLLSQKDLLGGVGFSAFQALVKKHNLNSSGYSSSSAHISSYLQFESELISIYQAELQQFLKHIPFRMLAENVINSLDENLKTLEKKYLALAENFKLETKSDLYKLMKKASFAQLLANENQKVYFGILKPNSSDRKRFNSLSKNFYSLRKELEILSVEKKNWKIQPTQTETLALLDATSHASVFKKIRLSRRMKKLLESSFIPSKIALENWLKYLIAKEKFQVVEQQLLQIGVSNENEIDWIKTIAQNINEESWEEYSGGNSIENKKLARSNAEINSFHNDLNLFLKMDDADNFSSVFTLTKTHLPTVVAKHEILFSFGESLYNQIGRHATRVELEKEILKSSWINFVGQFPAFQNFSWEQVPNYLDEIIELQNQESADFALEIVLKIKANFDALFALLNTSSRKLNDEEKIRKSRLKKGRSLLVKEFSKTRSHPSIRDLLNSEAAEWIQTLLPIWMVNPSQVADFFPLKKDLFEFVLFDEATQIPMVNSLGALHRSKRAIIVGDEQQMTPTQFFMAGESEPLDLLHQARFTWNKVLLKHHYRSQNPELIAFSNRHFYNNELIAYPSAHDQQKSMELHFVPDGRFINRENTPEAKALAIRLEKLLSQKDSIGVVAFSETQLSCIYKQLSNENQLLLEERIENNTCFFRALENIQGDECDHLLISLGYGQNEEGKLLLNFGPLNRKSGRRRLNVLFSRAKKKIDFYSSIHSSDLVLSSNDSLNLLRQYLIGIEKTKEDAQLIFPYQLNVRISESKRKGKQCAEIIDIIDTISDANELLTLHRVLSDRNWEVHYS